MTKDKTDVEVTRGDAPTPKRAQDTSAFGALRHEIDRLFDDFSWPELGFRGRHARVAAEDPFWMSGGGRMPATDFVERDGDYEVQVEMPGLKPEEIDVTVTDGRISIKGETSSERVEKDGDYHLNERRYGVLRRSFRLPPDVEADKAEAKCENGVLTLRLPKSEHARAAARKIEVTAA